MNNVKNNFAAYVKELQKIICHWQLIPGAPEDEYDGLIHKILSHLLNGRHAGHLNEIIASYVRNDLALVIQEEEVEIRCHEIIDWWQKKQKVIEEKQLN
ncbi:MAG: hypothetical protein IPN29_03040 [Saprospiraceae bacterium]|nr:hypothetical protein [Saprospiraceae bacterium]